MFVGEGSDRTGVPTKMISVNCSANLAIYNPAPFFGIHAGLHGASLVYSQITVATGQVRSPNTVPMEGGVSNTLGLFVILNDNWKFL